MQPERPLDRYGRALGDSGLSEFPVRHPPSDWSGVLPFSVHEVQGHFVHEWGEERSPLRLDL